jgi:trimethylamine---corrinoid protein Co-methyltransferase
MQTSVQGTQAHATFRVLNDEQLQNIHNASLEVLQKTGYHVPVEEARQLVREGGGHVQGERAYFSPEMIERALKTIRPFQLFDRQGNPSQCLTRGQVTFSTITDTFYVIDPYTGSIRPFVKEDQRWLTRVIDALPGIQYVQCVGQAHDVPDNLQSQVAVLQTLRETSKPILVYPYDRSGLMDVMDALCIVTGSEQAFRDRPFLICAAVPAAPLAGTDYSLELLLTCAEREIPVLNYACPAVGGNSPADLVGTIILANADWLANLVMHQLKRPGAPFATGGFTVQLMDMRTTLWSYVAPDVLAAYAAVTDLAHWYGFPAFGMEMTSDTPYFDPQMGMELMAQCQWAHHSQVEMVHNAGIIGAGKLCAAEAVILADEIIEYTRTAMQPVATNPEKLAEAVSLIDQLGPLGEYVSHDHTLKHFRNFWYPKILDRSRFDPRAENLDSRIYENLNRRAQALIKTHQPAPLPAVVVKELDALEKIWYARKPDERIYY